MKVWVKELAAMAAATAALLGGALFWQGQQDKYQNTIEKRAERLYQIHEQPVYIDSEIITEDWIVSEIRINENHGFAVFCSEERDGRYRWTYMEQLSSEEPEIRIFRAGGATYHVLLGGTRAMDYAEIVLEEGGYTLHEEVLEFQGRGIAVMAVPDWINSWSTAVTWHDMEGNTIPSD